MSRLLDTNIAIQLRDSDGPADELILGLDSIPALSVVSWVELEGGVMAKPALSAARRKALDALLRTFILIDFDDACVGAYRRIVEEIGFSRGKVIDRMIAATALVHDLSVVTSNGSDFKSIPGLRLEIWPTATLGQRTN